MASKGAVGGVLGGIGAIAGAVLGYVQAVEVGVNPVQGAGIFALFGFILGGLASLFFRSLPAIILYIFIAGVAVYVFRGPIETMTGLDPIAAIELMYTQLETLILGETETRRVN